MKILLLGIKEELNNHVQTYLSKEFSDEKRFDELFEGKIKEKLNKICEEIKSKDEKFEYKIFADNGPLVDRYLAYLAGLGYYGINNNLITDKYGSYVFIGYIVNNYNLEPDEKLNKNCM